MDAIARERMRRRQRDEAMVASRAKGKTYAEIGREFGLSKSSVPMRIRYTLRQQQLEQSADPFDRIKPHTARALELAGLTTVEQVVAKYIAGGLLRIPGFGRKAMHDIETHFLPGRQCSPGATQAARDSSTIPQ